MNERLKNLLEKAKSAGDLAEGLAKEGIQNVSSAWQGVGLFRSLSALSVADLEKDETHYLLIPFFGEEAGASHFVLFSKRVIPEGYGATNSLPKERIFHLPDLSAEERLREQLTSAFADSSRKEQDAGAGLADRLEALAEQVDRETEKLSGGFLLVGGLTTLLNPIAGVGMIAGGILPAITGKLAKSGAAAAGDQLRDWSEKRAHKKKEKAARGEVAKLKPRVFVNPILKVLEAALTNPTGREDPLLEGKGLNEGFPNHRYLAVTAEGVAGVYEDVLKNSRGSLTPAMRAWLGSLTEVSEG
ncbi:MAG: hypothetical protein ACSHYB_09750 [Roseibacillus sp.]